MEPSTTLQIFKLYWSYWMRYPGLFGLTLLLGPAFVLQNVLGPLFIAKIAGQLAAHQPVNYNYIAFTALSLLGGICTWFLIDKYISSKLLWRVLRDMYNDCFKQLIIQDHEFFSDNFSGSLVTQANRFAKSYELFHVSFFLDLVGQTCGVLVALGIMMTYNLPIGLIIAVLWLLAITLVGTLVVNRAPKRRAAVALESVQTGELADVVTNVLTAKTFAAEDYEIQRYDRTNVKRANKFLKSWHLYIRNNTITQLLGALLQITLLVAGVHAVQNGSISIATFLLFQVYILVIIISINRFSLVLRFIEGILGDSHEMALLFERTPVILDSATPQISQIAKGHIELQKMGFDYGNRKSTKRLFNDFSLDVQSGRRIGLVGPSGGGKTTITKLLLRFMDIQEGAVVIDGQDIRSIKQADLHEAIAYVPQEPLLFHRSLLENISYGRLGASKEEVIAASKRAHAHEFITELPDGYDTLVGERGIKLSGGQRQRVAIARAILKNAPILILDEATSALDSESERYIQAALWELMEGKTSVVIAHRLSTIQHLDHIVVLDKGKIVEQGTHQQLLKKKGLYARLWAHQSGGFLKS